MAYVLYGARGSGSGIVEMACAFLGMEVEVRTLDARNDEHRGENYAAVNPHRKMPAMDFGADEEGSEFVAQSMAILLALDECHREAGLLPEPGSMARARAMQWMAEMVSEMYPLVEIMDYPVRFAPSEGQAPAVHDQAKRLWAQRWQVVESQIAGAPWCLPEGFCAADIYVAWLSRWDLDPEWRAEKLPKVEALTQAVRTHPKMAAVWAYHHPNE